MVVWKRGAFWSALGSTFEGCGSVRSRILGGPPTQVVETVKNGRL